MPEWARVNVFFSYQVGRYLHYTTFNPLSSHGFTTVVVGCSIVFNGAPATLVAVGDRLSTSYFQFCRRSPYQYMLTGAAGYAGLKLEAQQFRKQHLDVRASIIKRSHYRLK